MNLLDRLNLGWNTRLPMCLQTEAAECGLACLAMISGYYGRVSDLAELRRRLAVSLKGVNLKDLVSMADRVGLASRPIRLELNELPQLKMPCILHWDLNHFVVLGGVTGAQALIHDPAAGVRRLPLAEVSRHFTGIALELNPVGGYEAVTLGPRLGLRSLLGNLVGLKRTLLRLFVLALAIELFAIISPLFLQWVVDHALVTADRDLLVTLVLGFSLLLVLRMAVTAMRGWMLIAIGASLKVQARSNLFSHLLNLPSAYFEARHLGDVMSRFTSQETVLQAITTEVVESILDGFFACLTLVIMFLFAPGLTALVVAGAALYALLRWVLYVPLRQASLEAIVWSARRDSHFLETLRGVKTIKLFNAQEGRRAHWLNLLVESVNRQLSAQNLRLLFQVSNGLLVGALAILVIWLGAGRVLAGGMSIGMLLAFISYKDQFLGRVSSLIDKGVDLSMLRLHLDRLADIALTAPEPRHPARFSEEEAQAPVAVDLRNISFRYGDHEPWVLEGVSLQVEAGESVAIVGPSGCGKTTLLKILASLLRPTEGDMLVNGQPLAHLGIERWRSMIGVVMQDDQLFSGSIADNISFFADRPDFPRIEECARLAAVHETILAMPMGYNTLIGDMGTVLSGGQKQRVLIARALYRQPGLLLLDEATSHLDSDNEGAVSAAIRGRRITRIIVAHREETIRSAERVIHLGGVPSPQRPAKRLSDTRPKRLKGPDASGGRVRRAACGRRAPSVRRSASVRKTAKQVPQTTPLSAAESDRWAAWDEFLEGTPEAGFMQASWYADFRAGVGYECFGVVLKDDSRIVAGATVLKWCYTPDDCFYYLSDGPVLTGDEDTQREAFEAVLDVIEQHRQAENRHVSHVRIEPRWTRIPEFARDFRPLAFADPYTEPRRSLWIDLRPGEEATLQQMKSKGRYNIRVAQRHGVSVSEDHSEHGVGEFLKIYGKTAARHGLAAMPPGYFRSLVSLLSGRRQVEIFVARYRGRALATALVVYFGRRATYFFGGSLESERRVMAPYLLHFEIMRSARARGCDWYDLWGVAPQDRTDDPWQDISVFKRKFGGTEIALVPTLDYVYDEAAYDAYAASLHREAN